MRREPVTDLGLLRVMPERMGVLTSNGLVWLAPDVHIKFITRTVEAYGKVLSIDHGAMYPIKVEWFTKDGDKRITSFSPDEVTSITVKE